MPNIDRALEHDSHGHGVYDKDAAGGRDVYQFDCRIYIHTELFTSEEEQGIKVVSIKFLLKKSQSKRKLKGTWYLAGVFYDPDPSFYFPTVFRRAQGAWQKAVIKKIMQTLEAENISPGDVYKWTSFFRGDTVNETMNKGVEFTHV